MSLCFPLVVRSLISQVYNETLPMDDDSSEFKPNGCQQCNIMMLDLTAAKSHLEKTLRQKQARSAKIARLPVACLRIPLGIIRAYRSTAGWFSRGLLAATRRPWRQRRPCCGPVWSSRSSRSSHTESAPW